MQIDIIEAELVNALCCLEELGEPLRGGALPLTWRGVGDRVPIPDGGGRRPART